MGIRVLKTAVFYVGEFTKGRAALVYHASLQRFKNRSSVLVTAANGRIVFHCRAGRTLKLPVSLPDGADALERPGIRMALATGVALAQCSGLPLALPLLSTGFSMATFKRSRKCAIRLTETEEIMLGLSKASGDPVPTRPRGGGGFSLVKFGKTDCENCLNGDSGNFIRTTDHNYVRNALTAEAVEFTRNRELDVVSMEQVADIVGGGVGETAIPVQLPDPAAAIQLFCEKKHAVDVALSALPTLPPGVNVSVDMDLALFLVSGLSPSWFTSMAAEEELSQSDDSEEEEEEEEDEDDHEELPFAAKLKLEWAPFVSAQLSDARSAKHQKTPYCHAVEKLSKVTSENAGGGAAKPDALRAIRFVSERAPEDWQNHQFQLNTSLNRIAKYDPKSSSHRIEHCREVVKDGSYVVVDGLSDHVTEPTQLYVKTTVDEARRALRDLLAASQEAFPSPATLSKAIAGTYAPCGTTVIVRGNPKLFLLAVAVLILDRKGVAEEDTGEVHAAIQVVDALLYFNSRPLLRTRLFPPTKGVQQQK
jgi:hypothetical protein